MEQNIKFLINIPLKVESKDQAMERCLYLLEHLKDEAFNSDENSLENVAVIFGLNGKYSSELKKILEDLETSDLCHSIRHTKITFTWGEGGDIDEKKKQKRRKEKEEPAEEKEDEEDEEEERKRKKKKEKERKGKNKKNIIPYQHIREFLKNHEETKALVREMTDDDNTRIYFSFVDADTLNFNHIYSEYIKIARDEFAKDGNLPTVMSTGYEFDTGNEFHIASWHDRMTRVATAQVFSLGTYYPEPNFCVLVPQNEDHVPESFIDPRRTNMESAILITRVKDRYKDSPSESFKAVFSDRNPIIIDVPERFELHSHGLQTNQSHFASRIWAIGVYAHRELRNKESSQGITGKNRTFLINLLECESDTEFEELCQDVPFEGPGVEALIEAAKEVREYRKWAREFDLKLEDA